MKYILYICLVLLGILKTEALVENEPIAKQSDCWRCTAERCPANPLLAKSCVDVCKKASTYPKIKNSCQSTVDFKSTLAKNQGSRLAEVQIPEAKDLDKNDGLKNGSSLTPKGIFMLLQDLKLIVPGKNPDEAEQALSIKMVEAGYYSTKIYIVEVKESYRNTPDSVFVIKGLRNAEKVSSSKINTPQKEMQGLAKVQQFIIPELKGSGVHIAGTLGAFWYYDQTQLFSAPHDLRKNFVVVLGIAAGEAVHSLGEKYLKGLMSDQEWNEVESHVSEAIGKFHLALATPETKKALLSGKISLKDLRTTIHDDLHGGNAFYNPKTHEVWFIDAASMADSLDDKVSPFKDISDFCSSMKSFNKKNPEGEQSIGKGYAKAFPEASQTGIQTVVDGICKEAQPQK